MSETIKIVDTQEYVQELIRAMRLGGTYLCCKSSVSIVERQGDVSMYYRLNRLLIASRGLYIAGIHRKKSLLSKERDFQAATVDEVKWGDVVQYGYLAETRDEEDDDGECEPFCSDPVLMIVRGNRPPSVSESWTLHQ